GVVLRCQGDDHAGVTDSRRRSEQAEEEGGHGIRLTADVGISGGSERPHMSSDLVDDDQRRRRLEDLYPRLSAGRRPVVVLLFDLGPRLVAELGCDRAPHGPDAATVHFDPGGRVDRVPHDRRYLAGVGEQVGIYELSDGERPGTFGEVVGGDEAVGLSAAEAGLEPDDAVFGTVHFTLFTRETAEGGSEEPLQAGSGIGDGEEGRGIAVDRVLLGLTHHGVELSSEMSVGESSLENVLARYASVDDRAQCHPSFSSQSPSSYRPDPGRTIGVLSASTWAVDRKSTRLNSSHVKISYAV